MKIFEVTLFGSILVFLISLNCQELNAQNRQIVSTSNQVMASATISHIHNFAELVDYLKEYRAVSVSYSLSDIPTDRKVIIKTLEKEPEELLAEVVNQLLEPGQTFNIKYQGNHFLIRIERKPSLLGSGAGIIQGKVFDEETSEMLVGATVRIEGTSTGVVTDIDGNFEIKGISSGTYNLIVSFIGYGSKRVPNIVVTDDQIASIEVTLSQTTSQLDEVVVTAEIDVKHTPIQETREVNLIENIKNADAIVTGISAEQISLSLDFSAAEVAKRAPSVTLVNEFVNIRGMNERYNQVFLNNMIAPSAESDRRAFSFEMLPSGVIDEMVIYRSPVPELPADWAGGTIRINTRTTSVSRLLEVQISSQYRKGSSFTDFNTYKGGSTDWLGFDDGTRSLPGGFYAQGGVQRLETIHTLDESADNAKLARRIIQQGSSSNLVRDHHNLDKRIGLKYYDSYLIGGVRLNSLTNIFHSQTVNQFRQDVRNYSVPNTRALFSDSTTRSQSRTGLMQNFSVRFNDRFSIGWDNFFNVLGQDETLVRDGTSEQTSLVVGQDTYRQLSYTWRERQILASQLYAKYQFDVFERQNQLKFGAGRSYARDYTPDRRLYQFRRPYQYRTDQWPEGWNSLFITSEREEIFNTRLWQKSEDNGVSAFLDHQITTTPFLDIKSGFFYEKKQRDYLATNMGIRTLPGNEFPEDAPVDILGPHREYVIDQLLAPENFKIDGSGLIITPELGSGEYYASNTNYAGYLGFNIHMLDKKLDVYPGVRYEWNKLILDDPKRGPRDSVETYVPSEGELVKVLADLEDKSSYLLPSINLTYHISEMMNLRAAFGKTLNRQQFREVSVLPFISLQDFTFTRGNRFLKIAEIYSYDLRWEYYPKDGGFLSLGTYYKSIKNPIELFASSEYNSLLVSQIYANSPEAKAYGGEVEVRAPLKFLPSMIARDLSVIINASYNYTQVTQDEELIQDGPNAHIVNQRKRPLQGASPYIVNGSLFYQNEKIGTSVTLQYNIFGQRLVIASDGQNPGAYELPRHEIDFNIKQRLFKIIDFRIGVKDILNQSFRIYRDYYPDSKFDPSKAVIQSSEGDTRPTGFDHFFRKWSQGNIWSASVTLNIR